MGAHWQSYRQPLVAREGLALTSLRWGFCVTQRTLLELCKSVRKVFTRAGGLRVRLFTRAPGLRGSALTYEMAQLKNKPVALRTLEKEDTISLSISLIKHSVLGKNFLVSNEKGNCFKFRLTVNIIFLIGHSAWF